MNGGLLSRSVRKNYIFLFLMLLGIAAGCVTGALWPGATVFAPLGTIFINLMFCIVVPLVFASIAGSVATMKSARRAGRIMGVTVGVFVVTGAIAACIMLVLMKIFPPVLAPWSGLDAATVETPASIAELVVNFFTVSDFSALLSRKAMLPLIVFSILFGFGVQLSGGPNSLTAKFLGDLSNCMLKVVEIVTYYAPIAFFGFFASLVATYGAQITQAYARSLLLYYIVCIAYVAIAFPLFARFGAAAARCA